MHYASNTIHLGHPISKWIMNQPDNSATQLTSSTQRAVPGTYIHMTNKETNHSKHERERERHHHLIPHCDDGILYHSKQKIFNKDRSENGQSHNNWNQAKSIRNISQVHPIPKTRGIPDFKWKKRINQKALPCYLWLNSKDTLSAYMHMIDKRKKSLWTTNKLNNILSPPWFTLFQQQL